MLERDGQRTPPFPFSSAFRFTLSLLPLCNVLKLTQLYLSLTLSSLNSHHSLTLSLSHSLMHLCSLKSSTAVESIEDELWAPSDDHDHENGGGT
jgi:hypothetical protein